MQANGFYIFVFRKNQVALFILFYFILYIQCVPILIIENDFYDKAKFYF